MIRRECVWCDPPHPMDGAGEITPEQRHSEEGVSHGMCADARRLVHEQIKEGNLERADQRAEEYAKQQEELMDLLANAEVPIEEEVDAGGMSYLHGVTPFMAQVMTWVAAFLLAIIAVIVGVALWSTL